MNGYEIVIDLLNKQGYSGYLVGGCVRDLLLGKAPSDYDIATNATPEQTCFVFRDQKLIETGLKHGTVTVLLDGESYEITTFRSESGYSDGRHPDSVSFCGTIEDDLSRRDFTINAMAMDREKNIIDLFGGKEDLQSGVIRCVGDPAQRFQEDGLRILRALRFASVLGFEIEENTAKEAERMKERLLLISKERCYKELCKLLCGKNAGTVIQKHFSVLLPILPALEKMQDFDQNNPHHCYDLLTHTAIAIDHVPSELPLRLSALFHDSGKPYVESRDEQGISHFYGHASQSVSIAREALLSLKADKATTDFVLFLIAHHDAPPEETKEAVAKKLRRYGVDRYKALILLRRADNMAQSAEYHRTELHDRTEQFVEELLEEGKCLSLKTLAVSGDDLIKIGFVPGILLGKTLNCLLDGVVSGKLENTREELLAFAGRLLMK